MGDSLRFHFGELVLVDLSGGLTRVGRIVGHEPVENVGRDYDGSFSGIAWHVEIDPSGDDLGSRRMLVGEEKLRKLHETK